MSSPTRRRIFEAAWNLIVVRGEAGFTMAHIAKKAKISRQALYLHFADRAQLLDALVRYADEKRGLTSAIQHIVDAPTAREALGRMVSLQALQNPRIWAIALAFEAVRRTDKAAQRSWLLYVITSLRMWEDLVLVRGWTADEYQERVTRLLLEGLTAASR